MNEDGTIKFGKDGVITEVESADAEVSIGNDLTKGGKYYIELSDIPADFYGVQRIYFTVNEEGKPVLDTTAFGTVESGLLTITLYSSTSPVNGSVVLEVVKDDATGGPIASAAFVVKDKDGNVLKNDAAEDPSCYIQYAGVPVCLTGLPAGEYLLSQISTEAGYKIADDQLFTVAADTSNPVVVKNAAMAGLNTLNVTAQAFCNNVLLTAEKAGEAMETEFYAALFADKDLKKRVSAVTAINFEQGKTVSVQSAFGGLEEGSYYLAPTNEFGEVLEEKQYQIADNAGTVLAEITFKAGETAAQNAVINYQYVANATENTYPNGDFSYLAERSLTKKLLNGDGSERVGGENDEFTVDLYEDVERTKAAGAAPVVFNMSGVAVKEEKIQVKMTAGIADLYLTEKDKDGQVIGADANKSQYTVSYTPDNTGKVAVICGTPASAEILNQMNNSVVKLALRDTSGKYVSGVTMVVKDSNGQVAYDNGKALVFTSGETDYVLQDVLTPGQTYYLSQVSAASGYGPAADVAFKVKEGGETVVEMVCHAAKSTSYSVTVAKQVYCGENQVYAQDTTNKEHAAKGRYTFYVALFADSAYQQKVSNVQKITVKGLNGSTTFKNLEKDATYYVSETDKYGVPLVSDDNRTIRYAAGGKVTMSSQSRTSVIQNIYNSLPAGYRHTARLTVTKNVVKAAGEEVNVTDTFYAGIFRKSDYSDTPTVVKLDLKAATSAYTTLRILLPNSGEQTYYFAEVNSDGSRVQEDSFAYEIEIDNPSLKVTSGSSASVTITNREKSSKVTLYLTKKVYQGTAQKAVNETFYAGLFKDKNFTELYTNPVPLKLENKSELTLKLSLNLGTTSDATIYIAEVDQNGRVIKNERDFGYEIKMVNSNAAFTKQTREIQTILLNSVYGSVTNKDWNDIIHSDGNYMGSDGVISGNGELGEAAQTGDETPIALYASLMGVAILLIVALVVLKTRRKK